MNDERYEADELSELIDRVVLHGAETIENESSLDEETVALVNDLQAMAQATPMREGFARELEERFLARETIPASQHVVGEAPLRRFWAQLLAWSFGQHRWATAAALGLLLAVTVALASVGPQPVWADLQRLLSYVPGVGFVNLEDTRVLMAPVEVTRNGVTLRVEQTLAGPKRTVVVISSEGLPPDQLYPYGVRREGIGHQARLRLPDGRTLASKEWTLQMGAGTLEFPPLPKGVYRVTLEFPRLPLVPRETSPEAWKIPLNLRPTTGELVEELFPQPYAPSDASDTHAGVTLRVLKAIHTPKETTLRLQVQWLDSAWRDLRIGAWSPVLRDDLGHVQRPTAPSEVRVVVVPPDAEMTPAVPTYTYEHTLAFAPVSPSTQRLTLWADAIRLEVPVEGSFTVDLGDDPQVGEHWPLDVRLMVAGFPVHITGMRLRENNDPAAFRLEVDLEVEQQEDRILDGVLLESPPVGGCVESESGSYYVEGRLQPSVAFGALPDGPFPVELEEAIILIRGPWNVTWTVPGADEAGAAPVTLHPKDAIQARNGLTLGVEEVVLTDRLTGVRVGLEDPPPGAMLASGLRSYGSIRHQGLALEDDRSRRYDHAEGVSWTLAWNLRAP
jgi:hypothetical protein